MKAHFKYTFLTGLYTRGSVFAVIFVMNAVFITLGSLDLLPVAAKITAVSLGGVAIAVMMAFNIIGDIAIILRMFTAPKAYLYALVPAPRWKILLASVIAMLAMDIVTMAVVITSEVWLSLNLAGFGNMWEIIINFFRKSPEELYRVIWGILILIAGYLLMMMTILFGVTAKSSILFRKPLSGLLAFLLACACLYIASLLQLVLAPFSHITRYGLIIVMEFGSEAFPFFFLLTLLEAGGLFILTSKLMERKVNI